MTSTRIDLPLILPGIPDERDACIARLQAGLAGRPGISAVHVQPSEDGRPASLCIHFDPNYLTIRQVEGVARAAGAEVLRRYGHEILSFRALGGEDFGKRIEEALRAVPGVVTASSNVAAQRVRVEFERDQTSVQKLQQVLDDVGAGAPRTRGVSSSGKPAHGWLTRNRELVWSLAAGLLLLTAWVGERVGLPHGIAVGIYLGAYALGGFDILRHTAGSLRQGKFTFDIDLLMLLAATGAAILGEWVEGAFLLFLFSLAHALEHYALGRARQAIRALADLAPPLARVRRDGKESEVAIEEVKVGDVVVVRSAERIPVDGKVATGRSAVNQAPITGESVPVEKEPGAEVFAGSINGDGALDIQTTRAAGDRTLDRVIKLVEEAQTQKAPTQQFTDRFERYFVPAVLIIDVLLIVLPPFLGLWEWRDSFYRGMALLVAASPCALALGTPAAVLAGIAQAARKGVLIKGGGHLENLGRIQAMAFDKTGTLTKGQPETTDVVPLSGIDSNELLSTAAAVEKGSHHPLARAVVREAERLALELPTASDVQSITARGVRAQVSSRRVEVGSLALWEDQQVAIPEPVREIVARLQASGRSTLAVKHGDRWLGVLGVSDRPREGVAKILDALRRLGMKKVIMLTGDNRGAGEAVGKEIGIDEVRAELMPEDKVTVVQALLAEHGLVAMVGDGVNDAPALAHASVGIAMGGAGTAVALETADVALMGDDLARLPFAVGLSRKARRIIRQNLYLSLAMIAILIGATVTGISGIGPAVIVHEGSTLVVIANALRLLTFDFSPS